MKIKKLLNYLIGSTIVLVSIALTVGCQNSNASETKKVETTNTDKTDDMTTDSPENLYRGFSNDVMPELALPGKYAVGVRTLNATNPNQLNITLSDQEDRTLALEVWYPAKAPDTGSKAVYEDVSRTGLPFRIQSPHAWRDAELEAPESGKYPLVVISHGYTGYRTIMFYMGEHLASHGYIAVAIDHTHSTNADNLANNGIGFPSTLYHRSRDQYFVLNHFRSSSHFASEHIDTTNVGLIGYSMGAYGAVNSVGGCYNFVAAHGFLAGIDSEDTAASQGFADLMNTCAGGQSKAEYTVDPAWKAVVAFAPWGNQLGLFDLVETAKISVPMLYVSGSDDLVSQYTKGVKALYETTGSSKKYLLTYQAGGHNIAPHPAPTAARTNAFDIGHYVEPAWDNERLNVNNSHFVLAMMNCYVKSDATACEYLALGNGATSNQFVEADGFTLSPTWKGFADYVSGGMEWHSN